MPPLPAFRYRISVLALFLILIQLTTARDCHDVCRDELPESALSALKCMGRCANSARSGTRHYAFNDTIQQDGYRTGADILSDYVIRNGTGATGFLIDCKDGDPTASWLVFQGGCPSLGVTDNAVRTPSPPSYASVSAHLTESKGGVVRARFIIWRSEQPSGDVLAYRIQVRSSEYSQELFCLLLVPWLKPSSSPTYSCSLANEDISSLFEKGDVLRYDDVYRLKIDAYPLPLNMSLSPAPLQIPLRRQDCILDSCLETPSAPDNVTALIYNQSRVAAAALDDVNVTWTPTFSQGDPHYTVCVIGGDVRLSTDCEYYCETNATWCTLKRIPRDDSRFKKACVRTEVDPHRVRGGGNGQSKWSCTDIKKVEAKPPVVTKNSNTVAAVLSACGGGGACAIVLIALAVRRRKRIAKRKTSGSEDTGLLPTPGRGGAEPKPVAKLPSDVKTFVVYSKRDATVCKAARALVVRLRQFWGVDASSDEYAHYTDTWEYVRDRFRDADRVLFVCCRHLHEEWENRSARRGVTGAALACIESNVIGGGEQPKSKWVGVVLDDAHRRYVPPPLGLVFVWNELVEQQEELALFLTGQPPYTLCPISDVDKLLD